MIRPLILTHDGDSQGSDGTPTQKLMLMRLWYETNHGIFTLEQMEFVLDGDVEEQQSFVAWLMHVGLVQDTEYCDGHYVWIVGDIDHIK